MARLSDDERLAQLLRLIRRHQHLTQRQLARAAGVPRGDVMKIEAMRGGEIPLERHRKVYVALGGSTRLSVWFNGAAADRLLDERHASLVERALRVFAERGWSALTEVSFNDYGDRGSIDVFAGHATTRSVVVGEVKSTFGSLEEMNRTLDVKVRQAARLAKERFGWTAATVSRILIVPSDRTIRRHVHRHAATFAAAYPQRARDVRRWLRSPVGAIAAIWFVTEVADTDSLSEKEPQEASVCCRRSHR